VFYPENNKKSTQEIVTIKYWFGRLIVVAQRSNCAPSTIYGQNYLSIFHPLL